MSIDLKSVVCIDLRPLNGKTLSKVAESVSISSDQLEDLKKSGVIKVWIYLNSDYYVAYQKRGEDIKVLPAYCPLSKRETKQLCNMSSITYSSVKSKSSINTVTRSVAIEKGVFTKSVLDIDSILDKISSEGIESLTKDETQFLKNIK